MLRRWSAAHRSTVSLALRAVLACGVVGASAAVADRAAGQDNDLVRQCQGALGDPFDADAAIATCTRAIEYQGTSPHGRAVAYASRALARQFKDPLDTNGLILADCDAAIASDPSVAEAYFVRGTLMSAERSGWASQERLPDLDHAIALNLRAQFLPYAYARRAVIHSMRGTREKNNDQLRLAVRDLDEVIRLRPNDAFYYGERARIEKELGDNAAAQDDFATARQLGANQ